MALSRSFPKIAVVCGAETDLGQVLLRELLHSSEIDKVHAIAGSDPAILAKLSRPVLRKVRVHIVAYDRLTRALDKIPEADVAFCCLGTDKHAYEKIGSTKFHMLNYEAPFRFVEKMFELGVLHVAMLSHPKADRGSSSDMYKLRGKLEEYIRSLRRDAADFSPFISMFKVSGMTSGSSTRKDDLKEVAKAMRIDALQKSCRSTNPTCKKMRSKYEELDSTDVYNILAEARHADDEHRTRFWED